MKGKAMYVKFQSNRPGHPTVNVEMSADEDETKALIFHVEHAETGEEVTDYYIEDPGEILMFFEEVRKLEAEYKAL